MFERNLFVGGVLVVLCVLLGSYATSSCEPAPLDSLEGSAPMESTGSAPGAPEEASVTPEVGSAPVPTLPTEESVVPVPDDFDVMPSPTSPEELPLVPVEDVMEPEVDPAPESVEASSAPLVS